MKVLNAHRGGGSPPSGGITIRTNLIAEYLFDGNGDDTAGSYDGTARAANATWTTEGLYLDDLGSNQIGFTAAAPTFGPVTVAIAFKPITKSSGQTLGGLGRVTGNGSTHGEFDFGQSYNQSGARWTEPGKTSRGSFYTITLDKWHIMIASNATNTRRVWNDSALKYTDDFGGTQANLVGGGELQLARYLFGTNRHWHGVLGVAAFWDTQLGTTHAGDIQQVYDDIYGILISRGVDPADIE